MRSGQRWVADAFLAEVDRVKLNDPPDLARQDRLLRLARMVVVELVDETDGEAAALVRFADVVDRYCFDPTDPLMVLEFVAARQAYCDALAARLSDGPTAR